MTLRAIVVDDEQLARDELCYLLGETGGVEVVGQASDGIAAVGLIEDLSPDVVLLDIQMPGLTGFEVAQQVLNRTGETQIIFVTAFDHYAIDAFAVNAVDYLLKPVDPVRLAQAVERTRRRVEAGRGAGGSLTTEDVERIVQRLKDGQAKRDRLAVKVAERLVLIAADEMIYASLVDDDVTIVATHHTGTSSFRTLDELQAELDPDVFWRVHRSHLVNINKVKEIVPWFSRNYILRMKDARSTEIPVSRSQTKRLRDYLRL